MPKKKDRITVEITPEEKERLKEIAWRERKSLSTLIRELLEEKQRQAEQGEQKTEYRGGTQGQR